MSQNPCVYSFNILLLGDSFVGKTSLMHSFSGKLKENVQPGSQGLEMRRITIGNTCVRVVVYDTAGSSKFRTLTRGYYNFSVGVLLLYSIRNRSSFIGLKYWLEDLREFANKTTVITLVGCKCDMESERVISKKEGANFARAHGMNFLEVSAKTGLDVEAAFRITAISVLAKVCDETIDVTKVKNVNEKAII